MDAILVATLGAEPQVISLATQLQLRGGEPLCRVLFARGLSPQGVAEAVHISLSTANTYKTALPGEYRTAWGMDDGAWLSYHWLREKFAGFLQHVGRV